MIMCQGMIFCVMLDVAKRVRFLFYLDAHEKIK